MIPFFRSLKELDLMTQSRIINYKRVNISRYKITNEKDKQNEIVQFSRHKKKVNLPQLPIIKNSKWIKSKKAFSKFFDDLDYNNQIQSSYDITLLARQNKSNHHDAA